MDIEPCVAGPVERYEAENKKILKKSTLLIIYTWLEVAQEVIFFGLGGTWLRSPCQVFTVVKYLA